MPTPLRALILEDRESDAELVLHELRREKFEVEWTRVETEEDFLAHLSPDLEVILSDYSMPRFNAQRALTLLHESGLAIPFIIITGTISEEVAVESIKLGASDYLLKDRLSRLGPAVKHALKLHRASSEQRRMEAALQRRDRIMQAVGLAAEIFLTSEHWRQSIQSVLKSLGLATEVSRVSLWENHTHATGSRSTYQLYEWIAPGLPAEAEAARVREIQMDASWVDHWVEGLSRGEIIHGLTREFPERETALLRREQVRSFLLVPIFVGEEWWGRIRFDHCEEDRHWYESEVDAVKVAAKTLGAAIQRERTERALHESEEKLRQSQKLDSIGQLAGGIAHDFNNLLTVISGYSDLLSRTKQEPSAQAKIDEIRKASDRAAALTRQLLAFSRKQVLLPTVLDLTETVVNMDKLLQRLIGEDVNLVTILDHRLNRVKADAGQIEQVIMNLAINARDAMPQGGKLTIETMNAYLDESYARRHAVVTPGPYVMLAVSDTGIGMNDEIMSHIFEPFFTTKEPGKGTGLGLAMVYGIVKQSGGNIWVYSEPGQGATFKIYLPVVTNESDLVTSHFALPARPTGTESILLVEDEDALRQLLFDILVDEGYTIIPAASGAEALTICAEYPDHIDLLVTDVVMPGMGGRQLVERLSVTRPETKILYMSGYTDNAIVHHGVLDSGTAFLQKPFTPIAVLRKVREVLDQPQETPSDAPDQ
jgi:signal transduction histidine kinase/DNA-binding response OmpR family regulator